MDYKTDIIDTLQLIEKLLPEIDDVETLSDLYDDLYKVYSTYEYYIDQGIE